MKNGYKVVAVTPAGRKDYLSILSKYILKNTSIIDRWDIWINTENPSDLEFIKDLSSKYSFVNLVYPQWPYERGCPNLSIAPFWSFATDSDSIYIRFDDDVVFIDDNTIENLVNFRIENEGHLFIYPFIINNPFYSKNLQLRGLVSENNGIVRSYKELCGDGINDPVSLHSSKFAREIHENFINEFHNKNHKKFMLSEKLIWELGDGFYLNYGTKGTKSTVTEAGPQVSINCVCWFGKTMKQICPINDCFFEGDKIQREYTDEEAFLTIVKTKDLNMPSCTAPNTLVVHFLFGPQRAQDNMLDLLVKYKNIVNV